MFQNFQKLNRLDKGISAPIAILVIVAVAIACAGLALWQYSEIQKETTNFSETQFSKQKPVASPEDSVPSPDIEIDTSEWKTYSNEEYEYQVDYPSNWFVDSKKSSVIFSSIQEPYEQSYLKITTHCPLFKEAGFDNLKEYLQFNLTRDSKDKNLKVEHAAISGAVGFKIIEYGLSRYEVIYLFENDKNDFCYKLEIDLSLPESDVQICRKIRSTFKAKNFNWKTYRNEEYKFEVKYPSYWNYSIGPLPNSFYFGEGGPYEYQVGITITKANNQFNAIYKDKIENGCQCDKFSLSNQEAWKCAHKGEIERERGVEGPFEIETIQVGTEYQKMFYNFLVSAEISKAQKRFEIFNQMLSTFSFRFIEEEDDVKEFTYSDDGNDFIITSEEFKVLEYFTVEELQAMSAECSTDKSLEYFQEILSHFSADDQGCEYRFYNNKPSWGSEFWTISVIPNRIGYTDVESFKKDFDLCEAGGEKYPWLISENYLLFVSACGTGVRESGCYYVWDIIEPTIKLK